MSYPRRTFVVRVRAPDGPVVLEDVQTGERVRLDDVAGVETQIRAWLDLMPALGILPREDSVSGDS